MEVKGININEVKIDKELMELLPPLTQEEFGQLESDILKDGVLDGLKVWTDPNTKDTIIVDGHNRYNICKKHNIDIPNSKIQFLCEKDYPTRNDIIKWMLDNQLGRRNISVADKYEIVQKYKPLFEVKAKENKSLNGGDKKSPSATLTTPIEKVDVRREMAKLVGTSEGTYSKLDKIYSSGNEEVKKKVKSGEISINKAFEEIKPKDNIDKKTEKIEQFVQDDINREFAKAVNKITENLGLSKWELSGAIDKCSTNLFMNKTIETARLPIKEQQEFYKNLSIGIVENFNPSIDINKFKNTYDCDKLLDDLEQETKRINNEKARLYFVRQKLFDEAPDTDMHCEVEEINNGLFEHNFIFYIVKGENRQKIIKFSHIILKDNSEINDWISRKKITGKEKTIVLSKIFETQKIFLEQEECREQEKMRQQKMEEERLNNAFKQYAESTGKLNSSLKDYMLFETLKSDAEHLQIAKEMMNLGYKNLAKQYHPDITKDDGNKMQIINQVKDVFDKVIT